MEPRDDGEVSGLPPPEYFHSFSIPHPNPTRGQDDNGRRAPDATLQDGKYLPSRLSASFHPQFTNLPLHDLDPFYTGTFATVNGSRKLFRFGASNTLWLFGPFSPTRKLAIAISTHFLFSCVMVATVLVNLWCLIPPYLAASYYTEPIFLTIYTLECIVKLVARGFLLDKFTYLRNGWNVLDFVIIISGFLELIFGVNGLAGLRALKLIPNIPRFLEVFQHVVQLCCRPIFDVALLTFLSLLYFAILGVHLYMGSLSQKCIKLFPPGNDWTLWNSDSKNWLPSFGNPICGNATGAFVCPEGYTCLQGFGLNPDYGFTSFDNVAWAMLQSVRMFKVDFWEALYQQVLRTSGHFHKIYFTLSLFVCSFYCLALIMGVVAFIILEGVKSRQQDPVPESRDTFFENVKGRITNIGMKVLEPLCKWECGPTYTKFRKWVSLVILDPFVAVLMTVVLIVNVWMISKDHPESELTATFQTGHIVFVAIYMVEFVLKLIALHPKHYFGGGWTQLEFFIVVTALPQLLLEDSSHSLLWNLRVLRVFRLAEYWPSFNKLLRHCRKACSGQLASFMVIIQLTIVTFAVIGMELFGYNYVVKMHLLPDAEVPRWNFTDFFHSFLIVFRSLCGEWIESMWDCGVVNGPSCASFFLVLILVGNTLTLAFFILLCSRDASEDVETSHNKLAQAFNRIRGKTSGRLQDHPMADDDAVALHRTLSDESGTEAQPRHLPTVKISSWAEPIIRHKLYDPVIVLVIMGASISLTYQDIHVTSTASTMIFVGDILFTLVILGDSLLRLGARGLLACAKDGWTWLDLFNLCISLIGLFYGDASFQGFKAFRLLMVISRVGALKNIVGGIASVVVNISGMISAVAGIWLVFALWGLSLMHGRFYRCINEEGPLHHFIIPNKVECVRNNMTWENSQINFDHTPNAFLSLFMVSTFKGWITIMNDAIDSREIDKQPAREASFGMYAYFLLFIIFGVFLSLTSLVTEVLAQMDKQSKAGTEKGLTLFMDRGQLKVTSVQDLKARRNAKNVQPTTVQGTVQATLTNLITSRWFDLGVTILMTFYLIILASDRYNVPVSWHDFYTIVTFIFVAVITAEVCLKMISLRRHYFSSPSNIFDMCVAIFAIVELVMSEVGMVTLAMTPFCLLRAVKVIVLHLGNKRREMRTLLNTIRKSIGQILLASMVLLLVISTYSLFGLLTFQHVKLRGAMDEMMNFQTFQQAFFVMFQLTTGAGWDGFLIGLADEDDCDLPDPLQANPLLAPGNCGNATVAIPFLISFLFLTFFLVAFMFLTVILQYAEEAIQDKLRQMEDALFDSFDQAWKRFDLDSSGFIREDQLSDFLELLEPTFQIRKPTETEIASIRRALSQNDKLKCDDVFCTLVKRHLETGNFA